MQYVLRPMLATLTDKPFDDPGWVFETKWDGFRVVALVKHGKATLHSRNGLDVSAKYPSICEALAATAHEAVFDGELVAVDNAGRSQFQLLQNALREPTRLRYCAFDLLYLDRKDLRALSLLERKASLQATLLQNRTPSLQQSRCGKGIAAFNRAKRAQEEGVMAKRADGHYYSGQRTREWLKIKASQGQEAVIVGFTAPRRSRQYFGSLVLGVREGMVGDMSGALAPASISRC